MADQGASGLEQAYVRATRELQHARLGVVYLLAAALSLIYLIPDTLLYRDVDGWFWFPLFRCGVIGFGIGAYALNRRGTVGFAVEHPTLFAVLMGMVFLAANGALLSLIGGFESFYLPAVDLLFIIWCLVLVGGARVLLLPSLVMLAMALAMVALFAPSLPPARQLVGYALLPTVAAVVCVVGSEVIERIRRRAFEQRWELDRRNQVLRQTLEETERTQEELVRSESLAILGESVAAIMHELRSPVSGVTSVLEEVVGDLEVAGAQRFAEPIEDLRFSLKQQRRAAGFIQSLLDLSRRREGYAEAIDANAVVRDALGVLRVQFKRSPITFEDRLADALPAVRGNFGQLGQVLLNLGRNAAEAIGLENQGTITFETRLLDGRVEIICEDTGPGIPEDVLPRVFDSFFTTKPAGQGTGLGLHLARRVIERHGGALEAGRAAAGGARLIIRLPAERGGA